MPQSHYKKITYSLKIGLPMRSGRFACSCCIKFSSPSKITLVFDGLMPYTKATDMRSHINILKNTNIKYMLKNNSYYDWYYWHFGSSHTIDAITFPGKFISAEVAMEVFKVRSLKVTLIHWQILECKATWKVVPPCEFTTSLKASEAILVRQHTDLWYAQCTKFCIP